MKGFKLEPGDIVVNINRGYDPWSVIRRWGAGRYLHCFLYMGMVRLGATRYRACAGRLPMIFESHGRGASLRMLSERYGQDVVVMRLKPEYRRRIPKVLREAIKLASDGRSYYDYYCIVKYIIPRIIWEKLHLPLDKMPLAWHRDPKQVCSEALLEICLRAGVPVLPSDIVPLPGDFVESPLFDAVRWDKVSEEWV